MKSTVYSNILSGISSGIFAVFIAISFASFMFTGDLQKYLPIGFGLAIVSANILRLIVAKGSNVPGIVTSPFAVICIFNALMLTAIANNLTQAGLTNQIFPTTMALIIFSTLSTAATVFLLGYFKGGNSVRYVPFPVISGLLASIGMMMFLGGIEIIAGKKLSVSNLRELATIDLVIQIIVGIALAYFMVKLMAGKFSKIGTFGILILIASGIIFNQYFTKLTLPNSWYMNPIPHGQLYPPPITFSDIHLINWKEIVHQYSYMITMNFIFTLSFLTNFSGVEAFLRRDFNVNHELKLTGLANLINALFGGIAGCVSCPQTIPNIQQGGTGYLSSITAAILGSSLLLLDTFYLNYLPKSVLAGVPMCLGLIFLIEWAYQSRFRLPLIDYLIVLAILFLATFYGFIYATLFGITASALIFLINYSRTNVVNYALDGNSFLSTVERSIIEEEILAKESEHIYLLKLRGYIFFGSAYSLLKTIKNRLNDAKRPKVDYLIIDFALVSNIDSSAVFIFSKILEMTKTTSVVVLISHANEAIEKKLTVAESEEKNNIFKYFKNLDFAMEWCEEELLKTYPISKRAGIPDNIALILQECETVNYKKGDYIIEAGNLADELYYLISGKAIVQIDKGNHSLRLKTLMPGTFIGELGFLIGAPRSTSVIAGEDSVLYLITKKRLSEIEAENPKLLINFYKEISVTLSERIITQNKIVELLTR